MDLCVIPLTPTLNLFQFSSFSYCFSSHFSLINPSEDTQGSQLPQPHSQWMHMAPIKVMFHQRSLFHLYSPLRPRDCRFSIGGVWTEDLIEAALTTIHEEVKLPPFLGSENSPYVTITNTLVWNQVGSGNW